VRIIQERKCPLAIPVSLPLLRLLGYDGCLFDDEPGDSGRLEPVFAAVKTGAGERRSSSMAVGFLSHKASQHKSNPGTNVKTFFKSATDCSIFLKIDLH
jgi:hypothetical protein